MQQFAIDAIAASQLYIAMNASAGRSSAAIVGGQDRSLRQTIIALAEGSVLEVHHGPEEATLLDVSGAHLITTSDGTMDVSSADLLVLPAEPRTVTAAEDSTALLTVSKGDYPD